MFRFLTHANITIGNGQFRKLPGLIQDLGFQRPGVLVDEGFASGQLWRDVGGELEQKFGARLFLAKNSGRAEPTYDDLAAKAEEFRQRDLDAMIGIGGGSCMDTAKAIAALMTNPGSPLKYRGFDKLERPGLPSVMIPTTAGTGSEVSYNASFVDNQDRRKMGINGRQMFATHAILDAETTVTCPYRAAMGAGVDAMVHTLEGFVCKQANSLSDMLAREAFRLLARALPCLKDDPGNLDLRLDLLIGAMLGGIIQMNSGSGVAAAISYPLSVYYKVPHGLGGGLSCVDVVQYNINAGYYKYAHLYPFIPPISGASSEQACAQAVCDHLRKLWKYLEVPDKLTAFGITPDMFSHVLQIMQTQQPAFDQNPMPFTLPEHLPQFLNNYF